MDFHKKLKSADRGEYDDRWSNGKYLIYNVLGTRPNSSSSFPFHVVYQDPLKICFTPKTLRPVDDGTIERSMSITMDLAKLKDHFGITKSSFHLSIYIHIKGQFRRSHDRPIAVFGVGNLYRCPSRNPCDGVEQMTDAEIDSMELCSGSKVTFSTSKVTILNRRPDANVPCDQKLTDDDAQMRNVIIQKVSLEFHCSLMQMHNN